MTSVRCRALPRARWPRLPSLAQQPGWYHLNQYKNPANPEAHYRTTGPEIWRQTEGKVTHFVAGLGTCGTITGTGRFLKSQRKDVKVLGVHPAEGHDIPGVRSLRALKVTDFFLPKEYDGLVEIDNAQAYAMTKRLNQEESIIAGPSSGMALAGALKLIPDEPGVVAVVIFPDNAFKYTGLVPGSTCPSELFPAGGCCTRARRRRSNARDPERDSGPRSQLRRCHRRRRRGEAGAGWSEAARCPQRRRVPGGAHRRGRQRAAPDALQGGGARSAGGPKRHGGDHLRRGQALAHRALAAEGAGLREGEEHPRRR